MTWTLRDRLTACAGTREQSNVTTTVQSYLDFYCWHSHDHRDDSVSRLHYETVNGPGVVSLPAQRFAVMWAKDW